MESPQERIRHLLEVEFPGGACELETGPKGGIGGPVVWTGFESVDTAERQQRIWKVLQEGLAEEEQQHSTAILGITPLELENVREEREPVG